MVRRSGRYQVFLIFDGVLTAGLAAMAGLIVATFIHKDWSPRCRGVLVAPITGLLWEQEATRRMPGW